MNAGPAVNGRQVRDELLAAGHRWLRDHGTSAGVRGLSLAGLAREAGLPAAAVRDEWPTEEAFVTDLLCHLAGPECFGREAFDSETLDIGLAVLREHQGLLGTVAGRRAVIAEAIRQAVPRNLIATVASPEWRLYLALVAAVPALPDESTRIRIAGALQTSVAGFVARMSAFYQGMAGLLGLRFRQPSYTFEHVTTAGAALVEGFALRQLLADSAGAATLTSLLGTPLPGPAPTGGEAPWTLLAVAFNGLVDAFFDLDEAHPPPGPL